MKTLKWKLTVWYVLGFMGTLAILFKVTVRQLTLELHQKNLSEHYPDHPDWQLHGSFSTDEVNDIIWELTEIGLLYLAPMLLVTLIIGYFLASRSLAPVSSLNRQLRGVQTNNLKTTLSVPEADAELQDLAQHIQDLLKRLDLAFTQIKDYAVNIAHELKTPLSIMRIKVEQAGGLIDPELGESLETELYRLNNVVEQSLLLAKAERGQLLWRKEKFELINFLEDILMDFKLLGESENRDFILKKSNAVWIDTDKQYFKQIVHGILSNALKHGEGDTWVRVKNNAANGFNSKLLVMNKICSKTIHSKTSLQIGTRVMKALTQQQQDLNLKLRRGDKWYCVVFEFTKVN